MDGSTSRAGGRRTSQRARALAVSLLGAVLLAACGSDSAEQMLVSAKGYLAKSDIDAASIQLKNAVQKDGSLAEARYLLGTVYLEQGDVLGALRELRRADELGHPRDLVAPALARALVVSGDFDRAIETYGGVVLDDATAQARLVAAVADAHLAKGETATARELYETAVAADPSNALVRVGLGRSRAILNDLDGALADADAALALDPRSGAGHALRADLLAARGQRDEAIAAWEAAIQAQPDAIGYHFALISLLLRENDLERAESRVAEMARLAPRHPSTLYVKAFVDFRRDRATAARDGVAEILRLAPDHLPARLLAGSVALRLGDHVIAQEHLERVIAVAPAQALARRLLATSLLATGEPVRAQNVLQPLLDAGAADSATLTLVGQAHLATGDTAKAAEYLARVTEADPDDAAARMRLGVARLAGGDSERAFADLEAASTLDAGEGQPELARSLAHLRRNELDKALEAQGELERKQPENPLTFNLKGGILLAQQDLAGARAAFEQALKLKPDFIAAAVNLARIDLAEQRPADARQRFERIIAAHPANAEAYLVMADLQSNTGAPAAEVLGTLERAAKASPGALEPRLAIVRHHLAANDARSALPVAEAAAVAHPSDPQAIAALARVQLMLGEHPRAIASFNRVAGLLPRSAAPLMALGEAQRIAGDNAGAEQSLRRALAIQPDLAEAQRRLAVLLVESQRTDEALRLARDLQQRQPAAPLGLVLEGDIHLAAKQWEPAIKAFEKALAMTPIAELAVKLHTTQLQAGKTADADRTAASWLKANPDDLAVRTYLAERAIGENRLADAEILYRRMLEIRADNALVLNNLAWVAGRLKRPDAISLAQRADELAPNNAAILDTLGMLQVESGEIETGLANLHRAVALSPSTGALRINLAKAYLAANRKAEARGVLDELLGQSPENSPVHAEARRLKEQL